ncbi:MAG: glycosyltransferase family 2 protein [Gammaproteobacteria bacterium]|nr:glycosyltransferase family 2 protein [Gammaproteobacteria bacterium]
MTLADFFNNAELLFTLYLVALYSSYAVLNFLSIKTVWQYMQMHSVSSLPTVISGMEYPVSILVPGYNEELSIADSVRALLQMNYSEFEVVVINDGSKDRTLEVLINEFDLVEFPQALRVQIKTANVRGIYVSRKHQNLRVIDKENGGKADALNVGINAARYPLFCAVDADSILQPDSLTRIVLPFLEDPLTIAAGGTVRIANGCVVDKGVLKQTGLPTNILALYQVVEYLRGFLFGRLGWSPLNALLIVSGALACFQSKKSWISEVIAIKPSVRIWSW